MKSWLARLLRSRLRVSFRQQVIVATPLMEECQGWLQFVDTLVAVAPAAGR